MKSASRESDGCCCYSTFAERALLGLLIVNESANYSTVAMFGCLDRISGAGRFHGGVLREIAVSLCRDFKDFRVYVFDLV